MTPAPALRVLLVEDSESDAALVVRRLAAAGYECEVERVESAAEMRAALARGSFDAMISDYQLPQFDAPAALAILQASGQDVPFIVVSGAVGETTAVGLMKAGAHDCVMKDNLARLAPAVERELREAAVRRERRQAEAARARLVEDLRAVNELAIALGGSRGMASLYGVIAEKLQSVTGAALVVVSSYRADERALHLECAAPGAAQARMEALLGTRLPALTIPVSADSLTEILSTTVRGFDSLREISFGAFPEAVAAQVEQSLGIGEWRGMALVEDARLLGTCAVALPAGAPRLSEERWLAFARVCGVAAGRAHADAAWRESEARFATVFHSSPVSVAITRVSDGKLLDVNPAWTRATGYGREEVVGRSVTELGLWAEPAEREHLLERLRSAALVQGFEMRVRQRTGDLATLLMSAEQVSLGGERCMVTSAVDISERMRAEEAVRESEKAYRDLVENLNDAVFTVNVAGRITYVSPVIERVLGYAPSELLGRHYGELVHPEDRPALVETFGKVLGGQGEPSELRFRDAAGEYRWLRSSSRPLAQSGRTEGLTGVLTDVTVRRRAEEALRESSERLRAVFQGVTDAILVMELDGRRVVMANQAACAQLGYSEQELLRLTLDDIHPPEARPRALAAFEKQASGEQPLVPGLVVRRKDGSSFLADVSGVPARLSEARCLIGVYRDVTAFEALQAQLRQAQKMEAIGQLAGGVAHDFNNILCVIEGHCERLLRSLREDDPLWKSVLQIQASGDRAAALTRQLLAFGRKQPLRPEVLDLNEAVRELNSMLRRLIGEDVQLVTRLKPDLDRTKVDRGQLEQVIVNLAVNARDAMPRGGQLLISTTNLTVGPEAADGLGLAPGRYVAITVADTGGGIPAAIRERIFEPFFTTKEPGKGTGLGLSTVYGIVTQSGGQVRVESEPGAGSTFRVYLPSTEEKAAAPARRAFVVGPLRGHGELVLVVEDEAAMREVVRDTLTDLGYRAASAANGGEALLAIEEGGLRPELLLTDVVMPGMSGPLLAARLRRTLPALKVLYMSGYTDAGIFQGGVLSPGTPLLRKPFKAAELAAELSALVSQPAGAPAGAVSDRAD